MTSTELVADGLVTVRQACAFLGFSRATIWKMMDRGDLPYVRDSGSPGNKPRRIPRKALVQWAAARVKGV